MEEGEEHRKKARMAFMEEGVQLAKERSMRQARIEGIRAKKIGLFYYRHVYVSPSSLMIVIVLSGYEYIGNS